MGGGRLGLARAQTSKVCETFEVFAQLDRAIRLRAARAQQGAFQHGGVFPNPRARLPQTFKVSQTLKVFSEAHAAQHTQ